MKRIANRIHTLASVFADALVSDYQSGSRSLRYRYRRFRQQRESRPSVCRCFESGYNLRRVNNTQVAAAFHETSVYEDFTDLYRAFTGKDTFTFADDVSYRLNAELLRQDDILQHPVYNSYHTEHEMLRYLKNSKTATWL